MYSPAGMEEPSCLANWTRFFGLMTDTRPEINKKAIEEGFLLRNPAFLAKTIQSLNGHSREITVQNWRIYCLTPHPDSTLMWAHYAERHMGICLEFSADNSRCGGAFEVVYAETRPVIDCRSLANAPLSRSP